VTEIFKTKTKGIVTEVKLFPLKKPSQAIGIFHFFEHAHCWIDMHLSCRVISE